MVAKFFRKKTSKDHKVRIITYAVLLTSLTLGELFLYLMEAPTALRVLFPVSFIALASLSYRHHAIVFTYRIVVPIVMGMGALLLWESVHRYPILNHLLLDTSTDTNRFYIELYFQVVSTLYAICTAFLLWKGLNDYDALRHALRNEADEIQSVLSLMGYFDKLDGHNQENLNKLKQNFRDYITNIMRGGMVKNNRDNSVILRSNVQYIAKLKTADKNDEIALAELIKSMNQLILLRSNRVTCIESRMSPYLLMSLGFMSFSILLPLFSANPPEIFGIASTDANDITVIIFLMASFFTFMFITLLDISRPFDGFWQIKVHSFSNIQKQIKAEIKQHQKEKFTEKSNIPRSLNKHMLFLGYDPEIVCDCVSE